MDIQENIQNKVANSALISLDLEKFYPKGKRVLYDIKDNLFQGLMLREKDFRAFIKEHDWSQYQDQYVAIICSEDAIVPTWAYMLLANKLQPYVKDMIFGDLEDLEIKLFQKIIDTMSLETYVDERVVIKGCGDLHIPTAAYVALTQKLTPVVKSIMYGEPCSTVPIFKKK